MYSKSPLLMLLVVCSFFLSTQAQTTNVNKDVDLAKVYEQVVKEGYGTTLIYKDLANEYYFKSEYAKAKKWFEKLFSEETTTDPTLRFRYKQSLKALGIEATGNKFLAVPIVSSGSN